MDKEIFRIKVEFSNGYALVLRRSKDEGQINGELYFDDELNLHPNHCKKWVTTSISRFNTIEQATDAALCITKKAEEFWTTDEGIALNKEVMNKANDLNPVYQIMKQLGAY